MYYNETKKKVRAKKHMLMTEAVDIALVANVKEIRLTHFSLFMIKPARYEKMLKKMFAATHVGKDRMSVTPTYDEE